MKKYFTILKACLAGFMTLSGFTSLNSQTIFQWAVNMGGSQSDYGKAITVDASGNTYVTGSFIGTADFDPGPGTYTLTAKGNKDAFVMKLDASGNLVWAKQFGGFASFAGIAGGNAITIDALGNVYTTGEFFYTVDFDPGAGTFNLATSGGNYDLFISKLDASGNFVWAKQVASNQNEEVYSIDIDNSSNLYLTGTSPGICDFDPGAGTYTLSPGGYILKLNNAGAFLMAKPIANANSTGFSIKVDASGNIYTTGAFAGTNVDFDNGPGTFTMTDAGGADAFIQKLDNSGNFLWAIRLGGPGSEQGSSIDVDASGNVYSMGYFQNTGDFDPGAGSYTMTSAGGTNTDIYVSKLDASGNFMWAKQLGGTQSDYPGTLTLDVYNNVYSTGGFSSTGDFDPGPGTYTLSTIGGTGVYVSKLDASGNFVWANGFSYNNSRGLGIAVSSVFDVYTTGNFDQTTDFDPGSGTYTLTPNGGGGSNDIFVHKLGQSVCPTFSVNSSTSSFTLMCAITSLTLNAVNTNSTASVTYTWAAPSTATTTGSSYVATAAGVYTVSASAPSTTCIVTQTLSIIQTTGNVAFNVNTTGSTCNNNGSATVTVTGGTSPFTYTWSTGSNATNISSLAPGNYSLTVKDANQCTKTNTFAIFNTAASFSSVPICFVTVDSLSQYNVITWEKTLFPNADSFYVYRETGTNIYKKIASQPYSAYSQFTDTVRTLYFPNTGDPNVGTYRYKLMTKDSCGNYSSFSPYHNTLFTVNNNGTFSWSQLYTIEGDPNPVLSYILERDNFSTGNWGAIGSVSGTQSFIIDPNYATYQSTGSWRVRTQWSISCSPSRLMFNNSLSYSNRIKNNAIGIKENKFDDFASVYPNPGNGQFTFKLKQKGKVYIDIYSATGKKVYTYEGEISSSIVADLSDKASGVYFATIRIDNNLCTTKLILQ